MKMQIFLPEDYAKQLTTLAVREHRFPRQQAEILLYEAIRQAMGNQEAVERQTAEVSYASTQQS